jgi:filamentous hemagglutinin
LPNETVVRWGDAIGTNGNDIISVNQATGQVTLWDSKYRTATGKLDPSTTFEPGSNALGSALQQAQSAIFGSGLSDSVKNQALTNLRAGNFTTNTVGSGGLNNSVHIRFCGGNPC